MIAVTKRVRFLSGLASLVMVGAGSIYLMRRLETQEFEIAAFFAFSLLVNGWLVWRNWHE